MRAAIVHFAAESHNDNSLLDPGIFARTNVEGTVNLCEAAVQHGIHLHHISTDEVFGDLASTIPRGLPSKRPTPRAPHTLRLRPPRIISCVPSSGPAGSPQPSAIAPTTTVRQHPEKFIPRQITGLIEGEKPRLYGTGDNVRDWIHVDDHNDAVWAILDAVAAHVRETDGCLGAHDRGARTVEDAHSAVRSESRLVEKGQTFLIGANGERSNLEVVQGLLEAFGRETNDFVHVTDRPGHDRRYAIDPSSIETLGWKPKYTDFRAGLEATVNWYRDNERWWREARSASEKKYRQTEKEI